MITTLNTPPPTYPARPINGGRYDLAPKKFGTWYYEPKYNGWRALVHAPTGTCYNRHGAELSIDTELRIALDKLRELPFKCWLDCEALERRHEIGRGSLIVFDILINGMAYEERKGFLSAYLPELGRVGQCEENCVYASPYLTEPYAAGMWEILQVENQECGCEFYEGFVAKKGGSVYPFQLDRPDRTTTAWMKHRFVKN